MHPHRRPAFGSPFPALFLAAALAGCGATSGATARPALLPFEALPEAERWEAIESDPARSGAIAPEIANRDEVVQALATQYAPLASTGAQGTVILDLFVDTGGWVRHVRVHEGSGIASLDQAALEVGRVYRFSPAHVGGTPVPVWTTVPVTFRPVR